LRRSQKAGVGPSHQVATVPGHAQRTPLQVPVAVGVQGLCQEAGHYEDPGPKNQQKLNRPL